MAAARSLAAGRRRRAGSPADGIYSRRFVLQLEPMDRPIAARLLVLLLPAAAAAGCGDESTRARALAESVAGEVRKDCESASAPDSAMRAHLARLCACTEARIASTPMRFGESDKSVGAKVAAASKACLDEIGGAPGEGRR
jgi:hypothetical protein